VDLQLVHASVGGADVGDGDGDGFGVYVGCVIGPELDVEPPVRMYRTGATEPGCSNEGRVDCAWPGRDGVGVRVSFWGGAANGDATC